jgi:hypothetical protein
VATRAAAWTPEAKILRSVAGRELPADRLDHLAGKRDLTDGRRALGLPLEPASEPASLVTHLDHLDDAAAQLHAAPAQPGEFPEAHPGAETEVGGMRGSLHRRAISCNDWTLPRTEDGGSLVCEDPTLSEWDDQAVHKMHDEPVYRGIFGIDIEGFNRAEWTDPTRARLRARLHRLVDQALARAEIDQALTARSDTGDGYGC